MWPRDSGAAERSRSGHIGIPKSGQWRASIEELQQALPRRTLTMLYNEKPAWLASAHAALDAAVCDAYALPAGAPDDLVLAHLLSLNAARAAPVTSPS